MTNLPTIIAAIKDAVGPKGYMVDIRLMAPHLAEWRDAYQGMTPIVVMPENAGELAAVVKICADAGMAMVPQGGNTGLVGGAIPSEAGDQVLIKTSRMNKILSIDPLDYAITVEAGATLAAVQDAARNADRLFPLSLAAEGSCEIGGNIATNAGGVHVLKYGTMRDLVLGIEAVLPNGEIWNGLKALRKDTAGYDLKQLFIGAEGTLGIVTKATLKLFPTLKQTETAFIAIESPEAAVNLLARLRELSGDTVIAFELIPRIALQMVLDHIPDTRDPLADEHPWYALAELASPDKNANLRGKLEESLADALERGLLRDAALAESKQQRGALWRLRESISEAQKQEGGSIKHDIAVPPSKIPEFIAAASKAVEQALPGMRPVAFGHAGDGNVHFNLSQPKNMDKAAFLARWEKINRIVHDITVEMGGTIAAEHGIGRRKRAELAHYKSPVEIAMMRTIKAALDPQGLMNPGKVI